MDDALRDRTLPEESVQKKSTPLLAIAVLLPDDNFNIAVPQPPNKWASEFISIDWLTPIQTVLHF